MYNDDLAESRLLGKVVASPEFYDPTILVAVPRHLNRVQYSIDSQDLPFVGFDVWHGYELSFLTNNGLPVNGVLKMVYPCSTPNLVESKSFKLYLNSFNNSKMGATQTVAIKEVIACIKRDLSNTVGGEVECSFIALTQKSGLGDFEDYTLLEEQIDLVEEHFIDFKETPHHLMFALSGPKQAKIYSHVLRSNCKITNQPDWGTVFIDIDANEGIDLTGLFKYLVSFRNENHFHEEICEMIFKRLKSAFNPNHLMVSCIYTRRGGIDICPVRATSNELLPKNLINHLQLTDKLLRQ